MVKKFGFNVIYNSDEYRLKKNKQMDPGLN